MKFFLYIISQHNVQVHCAFQNSTTGCLAPSYFSDVSCCKTLREVTSLLTKHRHSQIYVEQGKQNITHRSFTYLIESHYCWPWNSTVRRNYSNRNAETQQCKFPSLSSLTKLRYWSPFHIHRTTQFQEKQTLWHIIVSTPICANKILEFFAFSCVLIYAMYVVLLLKQIILIILPPLSNSSLNKSARTLKRGTPKKNAIFTLYPANRTVTAAMRRTFR